MLMLVSGCVCFRPVQRPLCMLEPRAQVHTFSLAEINDCTLACSGLYNTPRTCVLLCLALYPLLVVQYVVECLLCCGRVVMLEAWGLVGGDIRVAGR